MAELSEIAFHEAKVLQWGAEVNRLTAMLAAARKRMAIHKDLMLRAVNAEERAAIGAQPCASRARQRRTRASIGGVRVDAEPQHADASGHEEEHVSIEVQPADVR